MYDTVIVPSPRNASFFSRELSRSISRTTFAILYTALSPLCGIDPWHERPVTVTPISMRPRWPRRMLQFVESVTTTTSGRNRSSLTMYCQQRPSQSSSMTVTTKVKVNASIGSFRSRMIFAA